MERFGLGGSRGTEMEGRTPERHREWSAVGRGLKNCVEINSGKDAGVGIRRPSCWCRFYLCVALGNPLPSLYLNFLILKMRKLHFNIINILRVK